MNKELYIKYAKKHLHGSSKKIMINQIETFFNSDYKPKKNSYNVGDEVLLKIGTLLHDI